MTGNPSALTKTEIARLKPDILLKFTAGHLPIAINLRLKYPISNTECPIMK
jgi:hypothetical protein